MVALCRAVFALTLAGHARVRGQHHDGTLANDINVTFAHSEDERCMHGRLAHGNQEGPDTCVCNPGWRLAGLTDPANFLKGRCSQYMCESSELCSREIPGSTCDVPGWNCNCGFAHASGFFGGDQTNNAKCMGLMYWTSDFICRVALWLMEEIWKPAFVLMCCSLFLGEKQVRCDCNSPKRLRLIWSVRRMLAACTHPENRLHPSCNGDCVHRQHWDGWRDLYFEFAWSIYFFDLGLWAYAFVMVLFLTGVVAGSIFALALCILTIVLAMCAALLMCLCGGGSDAGGGGSDCCNCHHNCDGCSDNLCPCSDGCCVDTAGQGFSVSSPDAYFLFYGPQPPSSYDCGCCSGHWDCCPRLWLCRPLTWVLVRFPEMPTNMWGGLIGRLLGTHQYTPEVDRYRGGQWWIDKLSFRTEVDLRSDDDWREQVRNFVFSGDAESGMQQAPQQSHMDQQQQQQQQQQPLVASRILRSQGARSAHVVVPRRTWAPFTVAEDGCQVSSFEDYKSGKCWLCCEQKHATWHKWNQCGHMFCSDCSSAMIQRRMPCPLCRQISTVVVEGPHPISFGPVEDVESIVEPLEPDVNEGGKSFQKRHEQEISDVVSLASTHA